MQSHPILTLSTLKGEKCTSRQFIEIKDSEFIWRWWPWKPGHEHRKSIFSSDLETVCNIDTSQIANQDFEIDGVRYHLTRKT